MRIALAVLVLCCGAPAIAAAQADPDRLTQTVSLADGKVLTIDITVGTVRIDGWDREDTEIVVQRRVPAAARARLPIAIDDTTARVAVTALQESGGTDASLRAEVTVRLPRASTIDRVRVFEGRLTINGFAGTINGAVERGPIDGADLAGTVRLETSIGAITISKARLSSSGLLRLRTFNGDVRLSFAERPIDGRLMALALNGDIQSDIPLTRRDTWGPRWAEATLGKGEPVMSIDVVTGKVEIKAP